MYIYWKLGKNNLDLVTKGVRAYLKGHGLDPLNGKKKKDKYAKISYGLAKYGIEEIRVRNNYTYNYRALEILLRPKLLIDPGNYNVPTSIEEFGEVRNSFNSLIRQVVQIEPPDFFYWNIKRIDYAIDVKIKVDLIPKYMFLFKKGNLQNYMLNDKSLKYFNEKNNVYIMCSNFTINWYDRYVTSKIKEINSKKKYKNLDELKGIFRFEVQISNISKKHRKDFNKVINFLNTDIANSKILDVYDLIVGKGDYYDYISGIEILNQVNSLSKRTELLKIYELIKQTGSVWEARLTYSKLVANKETAADKFSKRLNQIRKLGLNPVALPSEWQINVLENPRRFIEAALN